MDRFNFKDVEAFNNGYNEIISNRFNNKYLRFEGRSFPNTHHGRLKIIEDLMVRWSKKFNPPLDSHDGRIYINDMDWLEEQMYEWLPDHGKNGLTKPKIKKANMMFKRYGGRNLQFEIIQDFDNEPIIRKKKLVMSK